MRRALFVLFLLLAAHLALGADIDQIYTRDKTGYYGRVAYYDDQFPIIELDSTGWTATAGQIWVQASGWSPETYHWVDWNNDRTGIPETFVRFRVLHPSGQFRDVQFQKRYVVSESLWVASLDSTNAVGWRPGSHSWNTDLTSVDVDTTMKCYQDWIGLPIWNGYPNAVALCIDDGLDDGVILGDSANANGVPISYMIVPEDEGLSGAMTWAEIGAKLQAGNGIYHHHTDSDKSLVAYRTSRAVGTPGDDGTSAQWSGTGYPTTPRETNVDEHYLHDGINTIITAAPGSAKAQTFIWDFDFAEKDTVFRSTIDSVTVYAWVRVDGEYYPTSNQVRLVKTGGSTGSTLFGSYQSIGNGWALLAQSWSTDAASKKWIWKDMDKDWSGTDYQFGIQTASTVADTVECSSLWIEVYSGHTAYPTPHWQGDANAPDTLLPYYIIDGPRMIEDQLKPYDPNYRCIGEAYPYGSLDARVLQMTEAHYTFGRVGTISSSSTWFNYGVHQIERTYPTWSTLRRYEIGFIADRLAIFGSGASFSIAQVESATTAWLDTIDARTPATNGFGKVPRANALWTFAVHDTTEATPAQIGAFCRTIQSDGRFWVTTLGDAVEYWLRANPEHEHSR